MTNIRVYELQFIDSGTGTRTRGVERPEVLVFRNVKSQDIRKKNCIFIFHHVFNLSLMVS